MVVLVVVSMAACAGALFFVLDRPLTRNKRRNTLVSTVLLSFSAVAFAAGLAWAAAGWLSG